MLFSLALIFLVGMSLGKICERLKLPKLLGMILSGMILGPYALNLLDVKILDISSELRQIALIIILTRAGLNLDLNDLKRVGRPAIMMCFIPACFEIFGMILIAPQILHISVVEAAVMGAVVAAVSPAVIVPKMLKLMDEGYGTNKSIPQMIMAGASVDDVFVIVLFTAFTSLAKGNSVSGLEFIKIPISIILGIIVGFILGILIAKLFKTMHLRDTEKVIILLSTSFILMAVEVYIERVIGFSGLIAVMSMGISIQMRLRDVSKRIADKYSKLWCGAETILFVLVGATVNIEYALSSGLSAIIVILFVTIFRMAGVFVCLIGTKLTKSERLFCMIAYCPKATVQAAIGAVPLSMGLSCGNIVLTVAVLAILITAPIGAFAIDMTYKKFLSRYDEFDERENAI